MIFNGSELALIRNFKALSLEEVSSKIDVSKQFLHKIENSKAFPSKDLVSKLSFTLDVEEDFFKQNFNNEYINEKSINYYSEKQVPLYVTKKIIAHAELLRRLILSVISNNSKYSRVRIPKYSVLERVEALMEFWHSSIKPINNISSMLEYLGIILIEIPKESYSSFTIFSFYANNIPVIAYTNLLNTFDKRFYLLKEVYKLSNCRDYMNLLNLSESEIDARQECFARNLLLPEDLMREIFPKVQSYYSNRINWRGIEKLSLDMKVSKELLLTRAFLLCLLHHDLYLRAIKYLKNLKNKNSKIIDSEPPEKTITVFKSILSKKNMTSEDVSKSLNMRLSVLESIIENKYINSL